MIAEKVAQINEKILEQISYLQIPQSNPPTQQELENLWKVEVKGVCDFVRDMNNQDRVMDNDFITRDDYFDLQVMHLEDEWKPNRNIAFKETSQTSYDVTMIMTCITTKSSAKMLIVKAFENVGEIKIDSINTDRTQVLEKYWIGRMKNCGQNPDYTAFAIKYKIKVPYIEIDYSQVN